MADRYGQDVDGAGDWTVSGIHMMYSDNEWADVKRSFKHHWWLPKAQFADVAGNAKPHGKFQNLMADIVDGR